MSLQANAISNTLAALDGTGQPLAGVVDVRSISEVPTSPQSGFPILTPDPDRWGGEMRIEPKTFGEATVRYWESRRVLGYVYLHCPVGQATSPVDHFAAMSTNRDAIAEAVLEADPDPGGNGDFAAIRGGPFTVIAWIDGQQYHGFTLDIEVVEQINP